jgi:hypothetical protein
VKVGNKDLYASDDYNLDLKWEMFPKSDELISVTAFGKYIKPNERGDDILLFK